MKTCRKCGAPLDLTPSMIRKGNYICKPCARILWQQNRASRKLRGTLKPASQRWSNKESYLKVYYARPDVRKRLAENMRRQRMKPDYAPKQTARSMVRRAIKRGILEPRPCEDCGAPNTQAHHADYSRPLDVAWLCPKCHTAVHAKATGGAR